MYRLAPNLTLPASAVPGFWARVDKDNGPMHPTLGRCWVWTGARDPNGYGRVNVGDHRTALTHRVAYAIANGEIPDGLNVLHRCDNPPCVRPDHLFPGTDADNVADMDAKGRRRFGLPPCGEDNKWAKLTEAQVAEVRRRRESGETYHAIAADYGVTKQAIFRIVKGLCWARKRAA